MGSSFKNRNNPEPDGEQLAYNFRICSVQKEGIPAYIDLAVILTFKNFFPRNMLYVGRSKKIPYTKF